MAFSFFIGENKNKARVLQYVDSNSIKKQKIIKQSDYTTAKRVGHSENRTRDLLHPKQELYH